MDLDPFSLLYISLTFDIYFFAQFASIIILLFLSGVFSGSEVALFSLKINHLEEIKNTSFDKYKKISQLISDPKKLLATILILNNFANIGLVILFTFLNKILFSNIALDWQKFLIDVILITSILLIFGEVMPKIYASNNNVKFALWTCHFIYFLNKAFFIVNSPMKKAVGLIEKNFDRKSTNISVDHLSQALELSDKNNGSEDQHKILQGIVTFGNTDASEVMTPRIDVFGLSIETPFETVIQEINEKGFSRIPVFEDSIDQIKGVLYAKDLISHINKKDFDWINLMREPFFVPENIKLDNLLSIFKTQKNHLAIVADEYGGTSGIISLEDIIEEIVGDIQDEFDDFSVNYTQIDEKTFLFDGKTNLKDFCKVVNIDEEFLEKNKGEAETLAGLILETLSMFPKVNQTINFGKMSLKVEALDKKRIKQVKVILNE